MNCTVTLLKDLDESDVHFIVESACKANSDFQGKLCGKVLDEDDGWIAIVRDQGEIVGWARTEKWHDKTPGCEYDTLEAFVRDEWRRRGVCQFAATGLLADGRIDRGPVAIFSNSLVQTCRRMAVRFVGYQFDFNLGEWRLAY